MTQNTSVLLAKLPYHRMDYLTASLIGTKLLKPSTIILLWCTGSGKIFVETRWIHVKYVFNILTYYHCVAQKGLSAGTRKEKDWGVASSWGIAFIPPYFSKKKATTVMNYWQHSLRLGCSWNWTIPSTAEISVATTRLIESNQILHYSRWLTPKRVRSWRGPSFEEMSQRWRAVGNTAFNLTGPRS